MVGMDGGAGGWGASWQVGRLGGSCGVLGSRLTGGIEQGSWLGMVLCPEERGWEPGMERGIARGRWGMDVGLEEADQEGGTGGGA